MKKLSEIQTPLTKLVYEHAVDGETHEYYVEGWPCDLDVSNLASKIMDESFNDEYLELLLVRMEFVGVSFIKKEKIANENDS